MFHGAIISADHGNTKIGTLESQITLWSPKRARHGCLFTRKIICSRPKVSVSITSVYSRTEIVAGIPAKTHTGVMICITLVRCSACSFNKTKARYFINFRYLTWRTFTDQSMTAMAPGGVLVGGVGVLLASLLTRRLWSRLLRTSWIPPLAHAARTWVLRFCFLQSVILCNTSVLTAVEKYVERYLPWNVISFFWD